MTTVVADRIEVRGLQVLARCGVLPEERTRPQPLEVDVDVHLDLAAAGASDDLGATVDYGALAEAVAATATEPCDLLERFAHRAADVVLAADPRIEAVTVAVRKLRPPLPLAVATTGVRITRTR